LYIGHGKEVTKNLVHTKLRACSLVWTRAWCTRSFGLVRLCERESSAHVGLILRTWKEQLMHFS
jgi:hypothetical protein